ncbi:cyclodeaminase [Tranquillimonas rosea]|uniref:cyclodeaminase n=1 Tax=Tranquillimonas rosea TaxID=641238 RepID=UPI003BA8C6E0
MADEVILLTEDELRAAVPLTLGAVDTVATAFRALAEGGAVMPPVMSMDLADRHGEVDVKTAYLPDAPRFAVKVSTGFFGNAALGLPSLGGLMVVFSAETGRVEGVLLDNGYLTDLRTAAAGAVAARALAPETVETCCILGTGLQARMQARAAHLVRPFARLLIWGRDRDKAEACAAELGPALGVDAQAVDDAGAAVGAAQLVVTTTPSKEPILRAEWLHPGLHVTAMGSDAPGKQEIEAAALARADLYVADRVQQCETIGELRAAIAAGTWRDSTPPELGEILTERHPGRTAPEEITICDLTGTGAQDTVIANHALEQAGAAGAGRRIAAREGQPKT